MKKIIFISIIISSFAVLLGCTDKVSELVTYKINEPVFMDAATFRGSVKVVAEPQAIGKVGKMCFYDGYLYISEPEKGIHIIDNRDPSHPQIIGFIELIGNADLSIRNNMLYADSYVDLVWFDIANPAQPKLKGRLENVFETALPVIDNGYRFDYNMCYNGDSTGIVVGWELKERTEKPDKYTGGWYWGWGQPQAMTAEYDATVVPTNSNGIAGSMSRFTIYEGYLYTVINSAMSIFRLDAGSPEKVSDNIYLGWNVETIFSYKDNMFMGTPAGMVIYSVQNPLQPEYKSFTSHIFGCDPVVVENDLAYVTVRSGNNCGQNINKLFVIDVSSVDSPRQIAAYDMVNPKGLGIDSNKLFLCDDGLKIFDVTNSQKIDSNQLAHYRGFDGFDVIPYNNNLMMIAEDGLYQYDYSNLGNIKQISEIPIGD